MVKLDKWLILDETAGWKDIIFLSSNFYKADSRTAGWCPQPYYTHSEPKIFFCLSCPLQSMSQSCVVCVCFPHLLPRLVWLIAKAPENQGCMSLMGLSCEVPRTGLSGCFQNGSPKKCTTVFKETAVNVSLASLTVSCGLPHWIIALPKWTRKHQRLFPLYEARTDLKAL